MRSLKATACSWAGVVRYATVGWHLDAPHESPPGPSLGDSGGGDEPVPFDPGCSE